MADAATRARALRAYEDETSECRRCPLADGRSRVVFGAGDPDADLMLVGESPGFQEDRLGAPFLGPAGELVDRLLAGIGLEREAVYLVDILKCRPPGNRDPLPDEIAACEPHLFRQLELVRPRVVASLGNVATRLLSGKEHGITRVHGRAQKVGIGGAHVVLYPLFHPAAALYTPSMLRILEEDFGRIPALLGPPETQPPAPPVAAAPSPATVLAAEQVQLGLF